MSISERAVSQPRIRELKSHPTRTWPFMSMGRSQSRRVVSSWFWNASDCSPRTRLKQAGIGRKDGQASGRHVTIIGEQNQRMLFGNLSDQLIVKILTTFLKIGE